MEKMITNSSAQQDNLNQLFNKVQQEQIPYEELRAERDRLTQQLSKLADRAGSYKKKPISTMEKIISAAQIGMNLIQRTSGNRGSRARSRRDFGNIMSGIDARRQAAEEEHYGKFLKGIESDKSKIGLLLNSLNQRTQDETNELNAAMKALQVGSAKMTTENTLRGQDYTLQNQRLTLAANKRKSDLESKFLKLGRAGMTNEELQLLRYETHDEYDSRMQRELGEQYGKYRKEAEKQAEARVKPQVTALEEMRKMHIKAGGDPNDPAYIELTNRMLFLTKERQAHENYIVEQMITQDNPEAKTETTPKPFVYSFEKTEDQKQVIEDRSPGITGAAGQLGSAMDELVWGKGLGDATLKANYSEAPRAWSPLPTPGIESSRGKLSTGKSPMPLRSKNFIQSFADMNKNVQQAVVSAFTTDIDYSKGKTLSQKAQEQFFEGLFNKKDFRQEASIAGSKALELSRSQSALKTYKNSIGNRGDEYVKNASNANSLFEFNKMMSEMEMNY